MPDPSLRVLVVDDDHDSADSLALLLGVEGNDARVAYDGPTALTMATDFRPQVVLLDLAMPGMDGCEVARRLRQLPGMTRALLVCVTGYGREQDHEAARQAGCDHFLLKPVDVDQVLALLRKETRLPRPEPMRGAERHTTGTDEVHQLLDAVREAPARWLAGRPHPVDVEGAWPSKHEFNRALVRAAALITRA